MDIDKLEAGRELDALIAERVFGWVWLQRVGDDCAWLFPPDSKDVDTGKKGIFDEPIIERSYWPHTSGAVVGPFGPFCGGSKLESYTPHYSTDITAAWLVVEKLQEDTRNDDDSCQIVLHYAGPRYAASFDPCPYDVDRLDDAPESFSRSARGETAPLAICRAALKAKGAA